MCRDRSNYMCSGKETDVCECRYNNLFQTIQELVKQRVKENVFMAFKTLVSYEIMQELVQQHVKENGFMAFLTLVYMKQCKKLSNNV